MINFGSLAQVCSNKIFKKKKFLQKSFHTYFMKGQSREKILSESSQKSILKFIEKNPDSYSFMIYNNDQLNTQILNWRRKLPWIDPFYAIKSNPISPLISDIKKNDLGFDCASKIEIQTVLDLGTSPSKIVYSNPIKEKSHIAFAAQNGVFLTSADTIEELKKIQSISPKFKILWRISIKEENTHKLATIFSNKFGDDLESLDEITQRFKQIKKMGINLEGIHFHCGSGKEGSDGFTKAIELAKNCIAVGRKLGHRMEILNLGGGFPSGAITPGLVSTLKSTYKDPLGYRVMCEPGRHFSSLTCFLATKILGKRTKGDKVCYHLNDSLYHSFNCNIMDGSTFENDNEQFYGAWENGILKADEFELTNQLKKGSLFGMTCDGMDVISHNLCLPEMDIDDWIVLGGMGAYTFGPKSQFNGMQALENIHVWNDYSIYHDEEEDTNRFRRNEQQTPGIFDIL